MFTYLPILAMIVFLSMVLLFAHFCVRDILARRAQKLAMTVGAAGSDETAVARQFHLAGRAARACSNFMETYPAFLALVFVLLFTRTMSFSILVGATLWLIARIAYLPVYLSGTSYIRTVIWMVSIVGLLWMGLFFLYYGDFSHIFRQVVELWQVLYSWGK